VIAEESQGLAASLGYAFSKPELLELALTHRSFAGSHNERLEFLGDSLLNCIIAILLYDRLPRWPEGDLSRLRATLVNQAALVDVAERLGLGDYLRLGEGEMKSGGFRRPSILADAVEAIIGAVFLDGGFDGARAVVERHWRERVANAAQVAPPKDPKTALQEVLQARRHPLPRYVVVGTLGDAHEQSFNVECQVEAFGIVTQGSGPSRRAAEQDAAHKALTRIREAKRREP
jgi:ribonuclease-3